MDIQDADDISLGETSSDSGHSTKESVFMPNVKLNENEVWEHDSKAYLIYNKINVEWPFLSIDLISSQLVNDNECVVSLFCGTQADIPQNNEIKLLKLRNIFISNNKQIDEEQDDEDDEENSQPIIESISIAHDGGVNRIKSTSIDDLLFVASWCDFGKVNVYEMSKYNKYLDTPKAYVTKKRENTTPLASINKHKNEGFAMDFSLCNKGKLITGDLNNEIYVSYIKSDEIRTENTPFNEHEGSIEDLKWSVSEPTVFASCSSDRSIGIWDIRNKNHKIAIQVKNAHLNDVNVIDWNVKTDYLMCSGCDDGVFKVWDLRMFSNENVEPIACFSWHKKPITSIKWHPTDPSVIGVSSSDDQISLWDLSVESHDNNNKVEQELKLNGIPSQLLFTHQGQTDIKELHWCQGVPGCIVSTASDGLDVFKTISI